MSDLTTWLAVLCSGLAVGLLVHGFLRMNQALIEESREEFGAELHEDLGPIRVFLPVGRIGAMWIRAASSKGGALEGLCHQVDRIVKQAGQPGGILGMELLGMCLANLILGIFLFVGLGQLAGASPGARLALAGAALTMAFLPIIWILDLRARRHRSIRRDLPYALDLLTLGVEAGLDFTVAIQRLSEKMGRGPLPMEFRRMNNDLGMGSSRRDAMASFRDRIEMTDINVFVAALIQAEELGSPLGPILRIQGNQLRERRFQRAESLAMKAPVKIIFPLALFILPVTMMVLLVPVGIKMAESLGGIR